MSSLTNSTPKPPLNIIFRLMTCSLYSFSKSDVSAHLNSPLIWTTDASQLYCDSTAKPSVFVSTIGERIYLLLLVTFITFFGCTNYEFVWVLQGKKRCKDMKEPKYLRIIRSKTYRGYVKPRIIPNAIYNVIFV
jgi:hypothetical protein